MNAKLHHDDLLPFDNVNLNVFWMIHKSFRDRFNQLLHEKPSDSSVSAGSLAATVLLEGDRLARRMRLGDLLVAQETDDGIAWLGTAPQPILDPLGLELNLRRILQWVVGSHDFDKATVAGAPLVDHHDAITRHLFLANP